MPRGNKQKLLYIAKLFFERSDEANGLTIEDIIAYLEEQGIGAERKSLYDDIAELNSFGIKIKKKKENRECYYYLTERYFEPAEVKLLVDSIQSSKFISESQSRKLIQKLQMFVGACERKKLSRQVYVQDRVKTMNESVYKSVDAIHAAISDGVQVSFLYLQWNDKKELVPRRDGKIYTVSPWALTCDEQNYYLIAYDSEHGEIRHYRVDKMKNVRITDKKREGKEIYRENNVADYVKGTFGMMGGRDSAVQVRIPAEKVGIFLDRFGKEVRIFKSGNGVCEISFHVRLSPHFFGWMAGLGSDVVITGPKEALAGAKKFARDLANNYR